MSEFRIDQITNQSGSRGPDIAGITTFTGTSGMVMPSGPTEYRGGRGRGLFLQGRSPSSDTNIIDYVTIATTGNAQDFGDLSKASLGGSALASSTRGLSATGYDAPTQDNIIDYITISSTGNAFDFGDLITAFQYGNACSSSTRGLFANGLQNIPANVYNSTINAVTIASKGDAFDFGDVSFARRSSNNGISNGTRGIFGGGNYGPTLLNTIEFVTITTLGNGQDFGDLLEPLTNISSCSNSVRGLYGGGGTPSAVNTIQYITIASIGDAIDFGDLSTVRYFFASACASSIRGLFGGGNEAPAFVNTIDFVTIASTGNASDFGDLTVGRDGLSACSDAHGGLGD